MPMKRRTIILGGGALVAGSGIAFMARSRGGEPISLQSFDWKASDFRAGGTAGINGVLPEPIFRAEPQCIATLAQTLGPCHTNDVPIRSDVTEGVTGLPTRISLRLAEASTCKPVEGADVEIWHADARGVYSGEAATMCNADDAEARATSFLRGRQVSDANGVVSFLTVYPGWYPSRAVHIHLRILLGDRELLVSQLLFDDALSDLVYQGHPDYAARPVRATMNGGDTVFASSDAARFIFDFEKLDTGVLQASYTIGVAA
ncbi:protocatechuate 3,4-dioxygenase subunit beta (plasmid) [Sinorhizobium americanum]|uniref:Protocatechuate 3,4-dioxygenase subunit beta n=2 Tax=Sinorhizobium americanum TaxID=194963 RepID=A0A1L3LXX6_9HYPH|nr:protocatechuate 3,4-dioxygenase subunit beta [Sinorhizobium americanum]